MLVTYADGANPAALDMELARPAEHTPGLKVMDQPAGQAADTELVPFSLTIARTAIPHLPWHVLAGVLAGATVLGLTATELPARNALRQDPVETIAGTTARSAASSPRPRTSGCTRHHRHCDDLLVVAAVKPDPHGHRPRAFCWDLSTRAVATTGTPTGRT